LVRTQDQLKVGQTQIQVQVQPQAQTQAQTQAQNKRKRQRLDHLSSEEKMVRRKLKNRVAAQSARDRKKVKMTELEDTLEVLEKDRLNLAHKNQELSLRNQQLMRENEALRLRLSSDVTTASGVTIESAELICDRQQNEQVALLPWKRSTRPLALVSTLTFLWTLVLRLWDSSSQRMAKSCGTFSPNALPPYLELSLKQKTSTPRPANSGAVHFLENWWGPHQKGWNPSQDWLRALLGVMPLTV
jgi:X box-binding protein 1